jgi:hypothetical protein
VGFSRRIRPLPPRVSLDIGAALAAARSGALAGNGLALKGLLVALAGLLMAPVLRRLRRSAVNPAVAPAVAPAGRLPRSAQRRDR